MKTTVIYHRADFDGIFCREIARKFLGTYGAEYIGWDHGDPPLTIPEGKIYILDLPVDRVFGFDYKDNETVPLEIMAHGDCRQENVIWIDHHKTSIESHPESIPGYRIDGVAACRLAWQWFRAEEKILNGPLPHSTTLPILSDFVDRRVNEPYAVQLAGEYDVWDKRNKDAEVFQMGLRSVTLTDDVWALMFWSSTYTGAQHADLIDRLLLNGKIIQGYANERDANIVKHLGFVVEFEGLKFLALNSAAKSSLQFAAKDIPETGHDALLKFNFTGQHWDVSLYHAAHRNDLDLAIIAQKYGGGGHRGACGFRAKALPWLAANPA